MASIAEHARISQPVDATNYPCGYASNIAELERLDTGLGSETFECNYALGERFFLDLYRNLGNVDFRRGFRSLYLMSLVEDDADEYAGTSLGIEHVRDAFRTDGTATSTVIARWYDGTEPYDVTPLDTRPVDARLPSINGRIDAAYTAAEREGPAVSVFSGESADDWVKMILKYSYRFSGAPREVMLEIVEYLEDGFQTKRRSAVITADGRYSGGTLGRVVGAPPGERWASGRYWVYVYYDQQKVAEVSYVVERDDEVAPPPSKLGTATGVRVEPTGQSGEVAVPWSKAANASGYIIIAINVNDISGDIVAVPLNDGGLEMRNVGGLTAGETYDVYVAATSSGGRFTLSAAARVTAK